MNSLTVRYTMILAADGEVYHRSELWWAGVPIYYMLGDWEVTLEQLVECCQAHDYGAGRKNVLLSEADRRPTDRSAPRSVEVTPAAPTSPPRRL